MKKQPTLFAPAPYASPVCKVVSVRAGRLFMTSPAGLPGEDFTSENTREYDELEDL